MSISWIVSGVRSEPYRSSIREGVVAKSPPIMSIDSHHQTVEKIPSQNHQSHKSPKDLSAYKERQPKQRRQAMIAEDLLTKSVFTINPQVKIREVWDLIKAHNIRHMPVTSPEGRVIGMITDHDLLRAGFDNLDQPCEQFMSPKVLTARSDSKLREMAGVLVREKIGAMPVVDSNFSLIGIVTVTDILRCLWHDAPIDLWV